MKYLKIVSLLLLVMFAFSACSSKSKDKDPPPAGVPSFEILIISPPVGMVGAFYTHTFQAVNGILPYDWSIASGSLPPGLSLDSALGKVSGTPTTAGTYNFVLRVYDNSSPAQTASSAFSILIELPGGILNITTVSLPDGTIGVAYSETVTALGGIVPYTWSISGGSLPDSLDLNSSTGEISGTPTKDGTFTFTVKVTDSSTPTQEAAKLFTITISPLEIITASLSNGNVGTPYNATLQAQGGTLPYTWFVQDRDLPAGLSLDELTGEISGTPEAEGTYTFTICVTDAVDDYDTREFSIQIKSSDEHEVKCYPQSSEHWTGYVTSTSKYSGDITVYYGTGTGKMGYIKFDISSISVGAQILSITMHIYISNVRDNFSGCRVHRLTVDPVTSNANEIYNNYWLDVVSQQPIRSIGWKTISFSATGISEFYKTLSDSYIALRFYGC